MCEIDKDGTVAHYTRSAFLEDILKNKTIKLSHVANFDDPRESSLSWIDTEGIGDGPDLEQWKQAEELKNSVGNKLNILCTCSHIENTRARCPIESSTYGRPRMWSQYGENSKGFCLVLNQNSLNHELDKIAKKKEYLISDKVEYYDWLHFVSGGSVIQYWKDKDLSKIDLYSLINHNDMLRSIYFKKSIDWRDESEYRWLLYSEDTHPIHIPIDNCIVGVVLGCNFPADKIEETCLYCKGLKCSCYMLRYQHPEYELLPILSGRARQGGHS